MVIINDILDYSKIEAERLTLYPEPFDLERTIHEVTMLLQPRARAKGIDLIIDYDMFLPTRFVGDPGRLRQVLTNLLGNAVKFTEKGHVLIRVVGLEAETGQHQLHVTVEDTGIGIPPEYLDHIFGEFNQVESDANRKFEGTGLGLAITQRLIERMEGAVWVDSEVRQRLVLWLPHQPAGLGRRRHAAAARSTSNACWWWTTSSSTAPFWNVSWNPAASSVHLCRNGVEALEVLAHDTAFDVVLTDHNMPEMDGLTLTLRIRAMGLTLPIVLLTSDPTAARDTAGFAELASVIPQKPILRSDLYRHLQALSAAASSARKDPCRRFC